MLGVKYGIPEVREVSRNLPGARGFALTKYEPMASHGDPIQPQNYRFSDVPNSLHLHCKAFAPQKSIMWTQGANKKMYVDTINLLGCQVYVLWTHKYQF